MLPWLKYDTKHRGIGASPDMSYRSPQSQGRFISRQVHLIRRWDLAGLILPWMLLRSLTPSPEASHRTGFECSSRHADREAATLLARSGKKRGKTEAGGDELAQERASHLGGKGQSEHSVESGSALPEFLSRSEIVDGIRA
jgi:hypothetical protein